MMRYWLVVAVLVVLAGCGGEEGGEAPPEEPAEKTEETTAKSEPTQASPRSEEEAAADEAKRKAAEQGKTRPTYEVANVRPGTITSTDLSFGNADVLLSDFGGRPYGLMANDPVLQEIADEIRADNPEYEMMLVSVYSGTEKREDRFMSNWYAFESPAAEQEFMADFESFVDEKAKESKQS